jgi:hypothetical protein
MSLKTPKKGPGDAAHAVVSAGLGSIPVAGAAASELFKWLVTPSLDKRRDEWMEAVAENLRKHEKRIGGLERLQKDHQFQDALIQASRIALGTSREEKREALRNAVINSALPNPPEILIQEVFLSFIETMSVWHLKFLKLAQDPQAPFRKPGMPNPGVIMNAIDQSSPVGNINSLIETVFQDLRGRNEIYRYVWTDLVEKGLIRRVDMGAIGMSTMEKKTTPFGDQFLTFIETPVGE